MAAERFSYCALLSVVTCKQHLWICTMFEFDGTKQSCPRGVWRPTFYRKLCRHFLWTALSLCATVRALRRRINSPRSCGGLNSLTCKALNALLSQEIDPFPIFPLKASDHGYNSYMLTMFQRLGTVSFKSRQFWGQRRTWSETSLKRSW